MILGECYIYIKLIRVFLFAFSFFFGMCGMKVVVCLFAGAINYGVMFDMEMCLDYLYHYISA